MRLRWDPLQTLTLLERRLEPAPAAVRGVAGIWPSPPVAVPHVRGKEPGAGTHLTGAVSITLQMMLKLDIIS